MREVIKMVVVLTLLCALSGGLLAAVKKGTEARIIEQRLQHVKGPVLALILKGAENNPIKSRFSLKNKDFFIGVFDHKPSVAAFEIFGKGFGGSLGVMVAVNVETDKIVGVGVTTHSETPGLGARAKTDPEFVSQFTGMSLLDPFAVKQDGGRVDSITGATISSRGVCGAMNSASALYKKLKPEITAKMRQTPVS